MAEFVFDRTEEHVNRLKELQAIGYSKLTASQREEYRGYAAKGAYNYTDVNRVEAAVAEIAPLYGLRLTTVTNHTNWTIPTETNTGFYTTRYLSNVEAIRDAALARNKFLEFPPLPDSMDFLTWETANNIEKTLKIALDNAPGSGAAGIIDPQTARLGNSVVGIMVLGKS